MSQRLSTLVNIDYVRVNKIDDIEFVRGNKIDDIEFVRVNKIEEEEERFWVYGSVIVTDCWGDHIVYHQPEYSMVSDSLAEYISLTGPSPRICGHDEVIVSVTLWVRFRDRDSEITKEIAKGDIVWDPYTQDQSSSYEKPLHQLVLGKHGSVTVGYSVIREAITATIDVVLMDESQVDVYGTVKAYRFLRGGSTTHKLFDISARQPKRQLWSWSWSWSLFSRPILAIPVPPHSDLTIEVDLWEYHRSADDNQIVLGSVQFTPIFGTQKKNITGGGKYGREVQVSITFE